VDCACILQVLVLVCTFCVVQISWFCKSLSGSFFLTSRNFFNLVLSFSILMSYSFLYYSACWVTSYTKTMDELEQISHTMGLLELMVLAVTEISTVMLIVMWINGPYLFNGLSGCHYCLFCLRPCKLSQLHIFFY
jgi:hypothetical protein